jgi:hypothetical protein
MEDEAEYQFHKRLVKEFFVDIEEYIQVANIDPLEPYVLIKNRFPYDVMDNKHYLLWIKPGYDVSKSVEHIANTRFPNQEIICMENQVQHRSILTVRHYHVFVKQELNSFWQ